MRWIALLAVCCAWVGFVPQRRAVAQTGQVVSLNSELQLASLARLLSRSTGETYEVDPALRQHRGKVSLSRVAQEEVPQQLRKQLAPQIPGVVVERRGEAWVIALEKGVPVPPILAPNASPLGRVTTVLGGVPLRKAYRLLFEEAPGVRKASPFTVSVDENVPDIPVSLVHSANDETLLIRLLTRMAASSQRDLRMVRTDDQFKIGIRPDVRDEFGLFPPVVAPQNPRDRRIVSAFERFPLRDAIRMVASRTATPSGRERGFEVDEKVANTPVTFKLITHDPNVLLRSFLAEARKQIRGLSSEVTDEKVILKYTEP